MKVIENKFRGIKIIQDETETIVEIKTPYSESSVFYNPLSK